jgi:isocitrate dehydrogenase kinase/phosphatase
MYHRYCPGEQVTDLAHELLDGCLFNVPFEDKERDAHRIVEAAREPLLSFTREERENMQVDVLKSVFYRSKAAYVIGRIVLRDNIIPFVLPMMHNKKGELFVDTVIFDRDELSVVFSFTRSFFMVETNDPSSVVDFLKLLMPNKPRSELYACIGFRKHSKTEFFRDFSRHLRKSDDQFIIAPGIKGMVMSVFTLPSYDIVFKIIKDRFQPPKDMTREQVKEKYRLVSRHDRVGRMADTQEFSNFEFDKKRLSQELLDELYEVAPSILEEKEGDRLVIKHMYTERRMIPLNIYLQEASDEDIDDVMDEYGNAIKQLAAANIFPGDMLLKNFGVTRHKRVVFYDYDEIVYLTDCIFRVIPERIPGNVWRALVYRRS